ncbi:MAG: hypothetical protein PHZ00_07630 [Candidatus Peribacteraceae bacterium]|nr:hypothetical protein [Candidatus Peribacteraceae bacterium]
MFIIFLVLTLTGCDFTSKNSSVRVQANSSSKDNQDSSWRNIDEWETYSGSSIQLGRKFHFSLRHPQDWTYVDFDNSPDHGFLTGKTSFFFKIDALGTETDAASSKDEKKIFNGFTFNKRIFYRSDGHPYLVSYWFDSRNNTEEFGPISSVIVECNIYDGPCRQGMEEDFIQLLDRVMGTLRLEK